MPQREEREGPREGDSNDEGRGSSWRKWTIINAVINFFRLTVEVTRAFFL
jgi:hypothetical protein